MSGGPSSPQTRPAPDRAPLRPRSGIGSAYSPPRCFPLFRLCTPMGVGVQEARHLITISLIQKGLIGDPAICSQIAEKLVLRAPHTTIQRGC